MERTDDCAQQRSKKEWTSFFFFHFRKMSIVSDQLNFINLNVDIG